MQQMQHSFITYSFSLWGYFFPFLACECFWVSEVFLQIILLTTCGLLHTHTDLWAHRSHSSENHSTTQ